MFVNVYVRMCFVLCGDVIDCVDGFIVYKDYVFIVFGDGW